MKKPNFFILGAPKCGTTSLASWLSSHPHVFMSPIKEPHYFSTDFNRGDIRSLDQYEALFEEALCTDLAVGEASTEYLYSENAVPEIEKTYPGSRYVVMVRNPVDLAYSLYNYEKEGGRETIKTFKEAWDKSPSRRKGEWVNKWCSDPKWLDYQKVASIGWQLQKLFGVVQESQVLLLFLDDIKADPRKEYLRVLEFLDLDDDGRMIFEPENVARNRRWPFLTKVIRTAGFASAKFKRLIGMPASNGTGLLCMLDHLNSSSSLPPELDRGMKEEMGRYFNKDVELLSALTGRDLSDWLGPR
jgi:hypothetical protein